MGDVDRALTHILQIVLPELLPANFARTTLDEVTIWLEIAPGQVVPISLEMALEAAEHVEADGSIEAVYRRDDVRVLRPPN